MDPPDSGLKEEGLVFPSQGSGGSLGEVPALGSRYGGPREDKAGGLVHVSSSVRNTVTLHPWRGIKRGQNLNLCEEKKPEEEGLGGGGGRGRLQQEMERTLPAASSEVRQRPGGGKGRQEMGVS